MELFGPTIRTQWNAQNQDLKDELINRLVVLFGDKTFNRTKVLQKAGTYLKYVRDQYRSHLEKNKKYEHPPMIPDREWKDLVSDGRVRLKRKKEKHHWVKEDM